MYIIRNISFACIAFYTFGTVFILTVSIITRTEVLLTDFLVLALVFAAFIPFVVMCALILIVWIRICILGFCVSWNACCVLFTEVTR